jgi:hypothetical protein
MTGTSETFGLHLIDAKKQEVWPLAHTYVSASSLPNSAGGILLKQGARVFPARPRIT